MSNDKHADNSLGAVLDRLASLIEARKGADPDSSYTAKLLSKGASHCARKFGEEAIEAIIAATQGDAKELTAESADVLYHLLVALAAAGVSIGDVAKTLAAREGISGLEEKASRQG